MSMKILVNIAKTRCYITMRDTMVALRIGYACFFNSECIAHIGSSSSLALDKVEIEANPLSRVKVIRSTIAILGPHAPQLIFSKRPTPYSNLGLCYHPPLDSTWSQTRFKKHPQKMTDQEWQIRPGVWVLLFKLVVNTSTQKPLNSLGRAIFVIWETSTQFFYLETYHLNW